jgi:hypothetical protein
MRRWIDWSRLALLVAVAVACTDESRLGADVVPPPAAETFAPPPEAPAPAPAVAPVARALLAAKKTARPPLAAAAPAVSLEKLLQVPPSALAHPAEPDIDELLRLAISPDASREAANAGDARAKASNVRVDLDVRTDSPIARPDLKREQVDAAASIDVGNDTAIKGGVRVERDSSGGVESVRNTTPTIGIEKRF